MPYSSLLIIVQFLFSFSSLSFDIVTFLYVPTTSLPIRASTGVAKCLMVQSSKSVVFWLVLVSVSLHTPSHWNLSPLLCWVEKKSHLQTSMYKISSIRAHWVWMTEKSYLHIIHLLNIFSQWENYEPPHIWRCKWCQHLNLFTFGS